MSMQSKENTQSITEVRNVNAKNYVSKRLLEAKTFEPSNDFLQTYTNANEILKKLIPIKANGFRGVVLTVIVGIYLDDEYNPQKDFYACSPRSIFEQGIYYALKDYKIPCGKSDPLNVAKNTQLLDTNWANGKRPESAATAAVNYIDLLWNNKGNTQFEDLIKLFFYKLYQYGLYISSQNVVFTQFNEFFNGAETAEKLAKFVTDCAEGGAVPQYVVGLLIDQIRKNDSEYRSVEGFTESVFGTNTTSKKPADVWEVLDSGEIGKLYEITVKKIDSKRLDDCVDALSNLKYLDKEIIFVCRLPQDTESLDVRNGTMNYRGINFQFIDIASFVQNTYILLSAEKQKLFLLSIHEFISDHNRAVNTKSYWAKHFS
jgi:hypothetical protein